MGVLTSGPLLSPSSVVYEKTPKGNEEIQSRKFNLPQKLRTVLIVVDGKKNLQAITNQFGPVGESLDELERQGFIARKAAPTGIGALSPEEVQRRVEMARNYMTNTVKDALGMTPPALTFADSLKTVVGLEEFREKLDPFLALITSSSRGKKAAAAYGEELTKLLFPK
jgi:hypothetical protein